MGVWISSAFEEGTDGVKLLEYTPRRVRGMGFRELQTGEKGPAEREFCAAADS
jgi:hypothetical protein